MLRQALSALQAGRIGEAEALCRQVRASDPRDTRAVNILSAIARQAGRLDEAEALLRQGLEAAPDEPQLLNNLGSLLDLEGQPEAALAFFERALAAAPAYAQAHNNLGVALEKLGRLEAAREAYRRAAQLEPRAAQFQTNLGNVLRAEGAAAEAEAAYRAALGDPRFLPAALNLAALLRDGGRGGEAMAVYREAERHHPHSAELAGAVGTLLLETGDPGAAEAAFRQALAFQSVDQPAGAPRQQCEQQRNLGLALYHLGRVAEAAACLRQALALDPDDIGALITLGQIEAGSQDTAAAVAHLERAVALAPDHPSALISLLKLYQRLCRWADFDRLVPRLDAVETLGSGRDTAFVEPPLFHITRIDDPARNLENARRTSEQIERRAQAGGPGPAFVQTSHAGERLRIAYLSRDFRNHPVGHLVRGLFAAHDRGGFEVFAYSYGPKDESPYRRAAERDSDCFVDLARVSNRAAAERINADGIDVLIDLAGHTNLNRLEICALRPAPVQATYLGFPGGSGAGFFDYLIGDPIVTPPDQAEIHREALAILPHAYQINDGTQEIAAGPADRREAGLPADALVLACFNQPFKFDAALFALWIGILEQLPGALLWLFDETGGALATELRRVADARGLDPARLIFAPRVPKDQHLARLALADLMLDTRLYNGHTTTSDALFAGLPVVTMIGRHFASRVSASLLTAVGLPELICDGPESYEALVLDLAKNPDRRAALRAHLAGNRRSEPLFDTALTARHLEAAYRAMWQIHCAGQAPRQILVADRRASP